MNLSRLESLIGSENIDKIKSLFKEEKKSKKTDLVTEKTTKVKKESESKK